MEWLETGQVVVPFHLLEALRARGRARDSRSWWIPKRSRQQRIGLPHFDNEVTRQLNLRMRIGLRVGVERQKLRSFRDAATIQVFDRIVHVTLAGAFAAVLGSFDMILFSERRQTLSDSPEVVRHALRYNGAARE
jgi:hypothetical protein